MTEKPDAKLEQAARRTLERDEAGKRNPEPSLARRFGQIGVLGWIILAPTLAGVYLGHRLDLMLNSGITIAAALTLLGAALGLWLGFRWMNQQ